MKRFQFNLAVLLRVYRRDEDEKKKRLGEANRALLMAEEELARLGTEYDECQRAEGRVRETGTSVEHLRLYTQYLFDLKRRIERQKERIRECLKAVRAAREKLIEAKRKVTALEKIREKRFLAWKKERNKFEMKRLDDICQTGFINAHREAAA